MVDHIPKELIGIMKDFKHFFNSIGVKYWLGGGTFKDLDQNKIGEIKRNWKKHDVDFFVLETDKDKIKQNLKILEKKGIRVDKDRWYKIAFRDKNDRRIEFPYLRRKGSNLVFRSRKVNYSLPDCAYGDNKIVVSGEEFVVPCSRYVYNIYIKKGKK